MKTHLVGLYSDESWFYGNGSYASFHFVTDLNKHKYGYDIIQFKDGIIQATGIVDYSGLELREQRKPLTI